MLPTGFLALEFEKYCIVSVPESCLELEALRFIYFKNCWLSELKPSPGTDPKAVFEKDGCFLESSLIFDALGL